MKISEKQYALSLYEVIDGRSNEKAKIVIKNFIGILAKHNQLAKIEEIIKQFIKIWNSKKRIIEAEVTGAREFSKGVVRNIKSYVLNISKAKEVSLITKVDKNILGGVIIKYGDKVLDGSLKARLSDLKSKLIR